MIKVARFLAVAAACLIALTPLSTQAAQPAASDAAPRPLMWVVRDEDSTLYIFGTIHALRGDVDWFTPAIRQRFDDSGELWLEIADMDDTAKMMAVTLPYVTDPQRRMTEGLTDSDLDLLDRHLATYGYKREQLMGMRKWAVALLLVQKQFEALGMTSDSGVDMTLLRRAQESGKPVKGFETIEEQLEFLIPDDPAEETEMLRVTLKELDEGPEILETMMAAWLVGDEATLDHHLVGEMKRDDPQGYERMLVRRNRNWVPVIEQILDGEGTVFIAVGGGHLVGPDSVITILREKGIPVERIDTAP